MPKTHFKLEIVGNEIRLTRYSEGVYIGKRRRYEFEDEDEPDKENQVKIKDGEKALRDAARKAKRTFLDLANCNFTRFDKFVTLTHEENVTDVDVSHKMFRLFIMNNLKRYLKKHHPKALGNFRYLAGWERQKRGAIHYHCLFRLPFIPNTEEEPIWQKELWKHGYVRVNAIKHVDNVGAYVSKYMEKQWEDVHIPGKKRYLCSKGLKRPFKVYGEEALRIYHMYGLDKVKPLYQSSYSSEWQGEITNARWNIARQKLKYQNHHRKIIIPKKTVTCFDLDREAAKKYFNM